MISRLVLVFCITMVAGACAPGMQRAAHRPVPCASAAGPAATPAACNVIAQREASAVDLQQRVPKDISTWMILLAIGFGALYLMAFR